MVDPVAKVQKYIPANFMATIGKNLPAIMEAINDSHYNLEQTIQACIDQLYYSTAFGKYLIRLGEGRGFTLPQNSGLDLLSYRVLAPVMTADPKQVRITVNELIKAFYGIDKMAASLDASVAGPYQLLLGDDLIVETESGTAKVSINIGQVSDFDNVTAGEISAVINSAQSLVYATVITDRVTAVQSVKIMAKTFGSASYIKIIGGKLQNILKFPHYIPTTNYTGQGWELTKTSSYTDQIKFTYSGGPSINLYTVKIGDIVTIRGLQDDIVPFSLLNGSYEVMDVTFSAFTIRNSSFSEVASSFIQPDDNSIVFTSDQPTTVFDKSEYAITSEVDNEKITVTVPAVPPIVKRFLKGAAHLRSWEQNVVDFTRFGVRVKISSNQDKPVGDNLFVLSTDYMRYDFTKKLYRTVTADQSPSLSFYSTDLSTDKFAVLPYTTATVLGPDLIKAELDSEIFTMIFPFAHGLENYWGFTLNNYSGAGNVLTSDINKEHIAFHVINDKVLEFKMKSASGNPIVFKGIDWGIATLPGASVGRYSTVRSDGSDCYIQFATLSDKVISGLQVGMSFKIDPVIGTNVAAFLATKVRNRKMSVISIEGKNVNFSAGFGPGTDGIFLTGTTGVRSGSFSGSSGSYYFDKTSAYNKEHVLNSLKALFVGNTPSANSNYVGSFLYDPEGTKTSVAVSSYVFGIKERVLKGESRQFVMVELVDSTIPLDQIPQNGTLAFGYGTDEFEGPIYFNSVMITNDRIQILLDPSYRFKFTHDVNAQIHFLRANTQYVPTIDGKDLPVYITGTVASRNVMFALLDLLVAAGIFVEKEITFPPLEYLDPSIDPYV